MPPRSSLYADEALKILDPLHRELEPEAGSRSFAPMSVRGIDRKSRRVNALLSTRNIDRHEERILPSAFAESLPGFLRNPILVAGHTYIGPGGEPTVIGHFEEMRITDEGLIGTAKFLEDDALADAWWKRFEQGAVRAFSVGFIVPEGGWEMQQVTMPDGSSKRVRTFVKAELIEVSAVAIPANRESLVRAAGAMLGTAGTADQEPRGRRGGGGPSLSNRQLSIACRTLQPVVREIIRRELDPLRNGPLENLIADVVSALAPATRHSYHHHGAPQGVDSLADLPDEELELLDDDELDELPAPRAGVDYDDEEDEDDELIDALASALGDER